MKEALTKILILWLASLGALCAQNIEGTWQGTLIPPDQNGELRLVFKIDRNGNAYQGSFYNLENGRQFNLGAVTLQGNTVKIAIPGNGMNYDGKVEAGGNAITGTLLTQAGTDPIPLPLKRATPATAWPIPEPPPPAPRMAENARLAFEVATIKPSAPDAQGAPFRVSAGRIEILNRSLASLIKEAWPLHSSQIIGAKGWMETERWDILGKPAATGVPNYDQLRQILRSLLADRFDLEFHMEEKELSVYAIGMGKTGQHKLRATSIQNALPLGDFRGAGTYVGRNDTIADLAEMLQSRALDHPVIDRTGIVGRFDFTLEWRPDEFQFEGRAASMPKPANVDALPDLFTAFQDQLGLKIEATKAPTYVFVIDNAQRPSEN